MSVPAPFTAAHKAYVKSLYRRILTNELNWTVRRDLWRGKALAVRAEFDRNRCVSSWYWECVLTGGFGVVFRGWVGLGGWVCRDVQDPRALAAIFEKAEADLAERKHPDPYRRTCTLLLFLSILESYALCIFVQLLLRRTARNGAFLIYWFVADGCSWSACRA